MRGDANLAIDAMYALYGCSEMECSFDRSASMSASLQAAVRSAQGRIITAVTATRPHFLPDPHAAAAELLGSRLDYLGQGTTT